MAIRKFLDISAGHLPPSDWKILGGPVVPMPVYPHPDGCGAFIWVTDDPDDQAPYWKACGLSDYFDRLIRYAHEEGCDYILFDRDAGPLDAEGDHFPQFDQETGQIIVPLFNTLHGVQKWAGPEGSENRDPV